MKSKRNHTPGIENCILLCPEHNQTSPNNTSLRVREVPEAFIVRVYGPPAGLALSNTDQTVLF